MPRNPRVVDSSLQEERSTSYQENGGFSNPSPSPTSSDKENRATRRKRGQTQTMASGGRASTTKRQRLANRTSNIQASQSQIPMSQQEIDTKYYDPDQDENERRRIRKGLRDLTRDLHGKDLL